MIAGELVALLATVTLPMRLPAPVGAAVTFTLEIVTFEFPLLVKVAPSWLLLPTFTAPKPRVAGFAPSRNVAATPAPLKGIASGELDALPTTDTLPDALPAPAGANAALKFVLCPGLSVKGRVRPLIEKPFPETGA